MITTIRKATKTKTAKAILLLTAAAVGGFFSLPFFLGKKGMDGQWVARVNGEDVSYNDFVRKTMAFEERIRELRAQYGQMADMLLQSMGMPANPRVFAANQLIGEALLDQLIQKMSMHVHADYVTQALNNPYFVMREMGDIIPAQLVDQKTGLNIELLRAYLPHIGLSMQELDKIVADRVKREAIIHLTSNACYVPEMELRARYMQEYVGHTFSVLAFDIKNFLEDVKKTPATQEQLQRYYDVNSKRYFITERRSGKVWEFDKKSFGSSVDQSEIEAYYNKNKQKLYIETPVKLEVRHIVLPVDEKSNVVAAEEKAKALRAELVKAPQLFEAKAKELSQDKDTASKGGLLPEFSRGKYDASFERAAFTLKNDGDISEVVRTPAGFEIIQRVHRKEAVAKSLASVRGEIVAKLEAGKFKDQFHSEMNRYLRDETFDSAERSRVLGLAKTVKPVEQVERSEQRLNKALFRLSQGAYDFYVDGEAGYVVQLTAIQPGFQPKLDDVKAMVEKDYYEQEAANALSRALDKAKKDATTKSFAELKDMYKARLETTGSVKFSDSQATKALRQKDYPVDMMQSLDKVGGVCMAKSRTEGYLCKLEAMDSFNEKEFGDKKEELRKGMNSEAAGLVFQTFVAFLHRNATIEVNKSIVSLEE